MSSTFASLANPNYRLWFVGALVSNTGTWMQRVAQDWLVLTVLTTNSGVAVGITTALQFAPMLLLGPVAGLLADRLPKRGLLMATQASSALWALLLGLLVISDQAQLWHVYALALLLGVSSAIDAPARQTFVAEMVGPDRLANAVGLNSASFHAARMVGPAVAGVLIAVVGSGPVFLLNAVTFGATVLALARMRVSELRPMPKIERGKGQIRDGMRYVAGRPDIVLILVIVGVVGTLGLNFQMTTALMARLEFDRGPGAYGLLGSIMAIGSLTGALLAARRPRPRLRLVVAAAAAFGVSSIVAALMPTYELFAIALVPVGLSSLTMMTAANAAVQLSTEPQMRGRVMALYMAIFMGGTPVGAPVIGWIGETFGAPWTILVGGMSALLVSAAVVVRLGRTHELSVRYRRGIRPHLLLRTRVRPDAAARQRAERTMAADEADDTAAAA